MVAVKPADGDAFVARPDPARPVVLVFGPDAGLVHERVEALIRSAVDDIADPFALVRLEADELSANPQRLVEEAQTIPLFGGRRAVWARTGGRYNIVPAVEALLALPQPECRIVIEAGELRPDAPLRKPEGGLVASVRPFSCPSPDVTLTVTTEAAQVNVLRVPVVGFFDAGFRETDKRAVVLPLDTAQKLLILRLILAPVIAHSG